MKKLIVNVVSESAHSIQGHGVHTAYLEMLNALRKYTTIRVIEDEIAVQVDCDIVHMHTVGPRMWKKMRQKNTKKIVSAHVVPSVLVGTVIFAGYLRSVLTWYLRWFYNKADLVLAVSEKTKLELIAMGVTQPIEVFHNFVDRSRYVMPKVPRRKMRKIMGIPDDVYVVIAVGQIQPIKRFDSFVAAAKMLPDVHFVWVGGIPFGMISADSHHMKKLMDTAPKNVHFPGIVPLNKMVSYYHAADLFWLPSERETFGLVIVEAAASGLPILLRKIPHYSDTFGKDALYAHDDDGFVSAIKRLQSNKAEYKAWKEHAAVIAERFDGKSAAQRLMGFYRQVADTQ